MSATPVSIAVVSTGDLPMLVVLLDDGRVLTGTPHTEEKFGNRYVYWNAVTWIHDSTIPAQLLESSPLTPVGAGR